MNEKYYKIDLHIHTPASKCYKGAKDDAEYIRLLKAISDKGIDIIAITDHNSLVGYEKLLDIEYNLIMEKEILSKYKEDSEKIKCSIEKIESMLNLFNSIQILPGVEFTINPGIHMIVISEKNGLNDLKNLLAQLGYKDEHYGDDQPIVPKMDIKEFLQNRLLENKLVIAPHADSDKGLYNEINGMYRADAVKNDNLSAVTFNNHKQQKKFQNIILNDPNYKRNKPLAFINASDAHKLEEVGSRVSYIRLEEPTFDNIYKGFLIPAQSISDSYNPRLKSIINNIISTEKTILIEDLDSTDIEYVARLLCAFFNDSFRYLIFGVSNTKELILNGIKMNNNEINDIIDSAMNLISINNRIQLRINIEQLGNGRSICIISHKSDLNVLFYMRDSEEVYVYKDKLIKASIDEIEKIIKKNLLNELKKYEKNELFDKIINNVQLLRSPIDKFKLSELIGNNGVNVHNVLDLDIVHKSTNAIYWDDKDISNGEAIGNIFFAEPQTARLNYAVLRYSCPRISEDPLNISQELKLYKGHKLIITKNGAVYIIDEDEWYIEPLEHDLLLLEIDENYKNEYSIYSIAAWLKSSLFLWFINRKHNNTDLFNPKIFNSIIIPIDDIMKIGGIIEGLVKDIINKEKVLLNNCNALEKNNQCINSEEVIDGVALTKQDNIEDIIKIIESHNKEIDKIALQIDKMFFEYYSISDEQIKIISQDLNMSGIYNIIEC